MMKKRMKKASRKMKAWGSIGSETSSVCGIAGPLRDDRLPCLWSDLCKLERTVLDYTRGGFLQAAQPPSPRVGSGHGGKLDHLAGSDGARELNDVRGSEGQGRRPSRRVGIRDRRASWTEEKDTARSAPIEPVRSPSDPLVLAGRFGLRGAHGDRNVRSGLRMQRMQSQGWGPSPKKKNVAEANETCETCETALGGERGTTIGSPEAAQTGRFGARDGDAAEDESGKGAKHRKCAEHTKHTKDTKDTMSRPKKKEKKRKERDTMSKQSRKRKARKTYEAHETYAACEGDDGVSQAESRSGAKNIRNVRNIRSGLRTL
ncbi:hypothetical protein EDB84DRAFT_1619858 [Lactarius hengduanensis]|nr:hypothetical protein EDB84DRAFT_1619858 [Lactarius hengduanensis]